jgi:type II secretory ATPase GspE/PulE/Tfp pilus assembly ATPase PilB-like protein
VDDVSFYSKPGEHQNKVVSTYQLEDYFKVEKPDPVKFVNVVVEESIKLLASDILFEPRKEDVLVRVRIDGVLYEIGRIKAEVYLQVNSRMKVLSNLDSTEKRKIQEGQFAVEHEGATVNLRVEITQTVYGEMAVIRIHKKETIIMDLAKLGLSRVAYLNYQNMLRQRSGLIVVCGPTGCGKTTTLYSTINELNFDKQYNVMTVEDPVEYELDGVNQMQVQEDIGFTFAQGLRTILRLSPDIILVGEIRDKETAQIAVESGLTGQLVLSTVHASDSIGALFRLLDLGIEPYLLNSSLMGIVAQRLVRQICPSCRKPYTPPQEQKDVFQKIVGRIPDQLMDSVGCEECNNLGFKGRMGVFEVLVITTEVRSMLRQKVNETDLRQGLAMSGFVTLLRDGLEKVEQGLTTFDEVFRNSFRIT